MFSALSTTSNKLRVRPNNYNEYMNLMVDLEDGNERSFLDGLSQRDMHIFHDENPCYYYLELKVYLDSNV